MSKIPIDVQPRPPRQQLQPFGRARKISHALQKPGRTQTQFLNHQPGSVQIQQIMLAKNL